MSDSTTPSKVPYEVWAAFRIRQLREEADVLEKALLQYTSIASTEINTQALSAPLIPADVPVTGKYAPLIAAWQSTPERGLSHSEIFALAQKTVKDVRNASSVRTFVFSLKNEGKVRESDGKFFIASPHKRSGSSQRVAVD